MLVIHTGTNDLWNGMITIKQVKKVVQRIRESNANQEFQIAFSGIIDREDTNFAKKMEDYQTRKLFKSKEFLN